MAPKIDLGFAIGLFGKETSDDLHRVRIIRNRFAHGVGISSFYHDSIAKFCAQFTTPKRVGSGPKDPTPRNLYTYSLGSLTGGIGVNILRIETPKRRPS